VVLTSGIISTVPVPLGTLSNPTGVAVDGDGNLLVTDVDTLVDDGGGGFVPSNTTKILKVNPSTGDTITVAGTGVAGFTDNVAATTALLNFPSGVAPSGQDFYIADFLNHRVRKIGLPPLP